MYLHGSKEDNWDKGEEIGLSEKALDKFKYALYEVEFEIEVNEETGESTILKVNGRELKWQTKKRAMILKDLFNNGFWV